MRKMPSKLQNDYYLMRHALSIPNERGIIISWSDVKKVSARHKWLPKNVGLVLKL